MTGHLVLVSKELLLVFVREGRKLSQCDRYDDVTSGLQSGLQAVSGLAEVVLSSSEVKSGPPVV